MVSYLDSCMHSCTFEYAQYRGTIRKRFVEDMSKYSQYND